MLAAGLAFGFAGCGDDRHENTFPQTDSPAGSDDNAGDEEDDAAPDPEAGNILVVYYSYTNNTHAVVSELSTRIDADIVRIEPAEKGLDYAAGNYALGSALISAIRANPDDAASYPEIDPVDVNIEDYDTVIVATPLWWSNMAAPMQTFLFENGGRMSGRNVECEQRYRRGRGRCPTACSGRQLYVAFVMDTVISDGFVPYDDCRMA